MKKLVFVLLLLLSVESYGVYGAAQTKRLRYSCTLEIGPLCYAWEESALGKILGSNRAEELEAAMQKARQAWEKDFIERAVKAKDSGALEKALEKAEDIVEDIADKARETVEGVRDAK